MWNPVIKNVNRSDERVRVDVEFSEGDLNFEKSFMFNGDVPKEQVWRTIQDVVQIAEKGNSLIKELSSMPIGDGEIAQPPVSADELAKAEYLKLVRKLDSAKRAIETGAIAADDPLIVNLKGQLATDFKEEYIGII